jgi:membrane protease YdiL (CAAX protease family)
LHFAGGNIMDIKKNGFELVLYTLSVLLMIFVSSLYVLMPALLIVIISYFIKNKNFKKIMSFNGERWGKRFLIGLILLVIMIGYFFVQTDNVSKINSKDIFIWLIIFPFINEMIFRVMAINIIEKEKYFWIFNIIQSLVFVLSLINIEFYNKDYFLTFLLAFIAGWVYKEDKSFYKIFFLDMAISFGILLLNYL